MIAVDLVTILMAISCEMDGCCKQKGDFDINDENLCSRLFTVQESLFTYNIITVSILISISARLEFQH